MGNSTFAKLKMSAAMILALSAMGCAKFDSKGASSKQALLASASVLDADRPTENEPTDPTNPPPLPPPPPVVNELKLQIPLTTVCSREGTENAGTNVKKSAALTYRLLNGQDQVVCEATTGVRENVMNYKKLFLTACPNLADGTYRLSLIDPAKPKFNLLGDEATSFTYGNDKGKGTKMTVDKSAAALVISPKYAKKKLYVLYGGSHDKCDKTASPLIVDTHSDLQAPQPIALTSPLNGIWFNIMGRNASPVANSKDQISWIMNSDRYKFLVKVAADGKVHGIDEMFGDNTLGPDNKFARDGFAALAKYDGKDFRGKKQLRKADGKIDANDDVYNSLALWSDRNRNGEAEAGELQSLRDAGLIEIDLEFDPNFREQDAYGNSTELKSVVKFEDGRQRLIFDLWFRPL